jgi:integrase
MHTLFNVALSEGKVEINPAYKVKARKDGGKLSDGRQGLTSAHIRTMLSKLKGEREDFAWIVRLLIYHGARSGEICQLRCDDVTTLHGVPVLRIHDRHGRVKNKASVRDIPIHPKCKKIIAYAKRVAAKHGADAWLSPELPLQKQGRAHWFQNYRSRSFLRETCGIKERWYTMHSLRHTWRTLAREIDMPEAVSRSIMGHSLGRDDHAGYGGVPSLKTRAEWMAKIDPLA